MTDVSSSPVPQRTRRHPILGPLLKYTGTAGTELLSSRNYLILLTARTLNMLGFAFSPVALAFGIIRLTNATEWTLSAVLLAQTLPEVVTTLFGGVLADRFPRTRVLGIAQSVLATSWISIGVLLLLDRADLYLLLPAAALGGLASAAIYPSITGIIPEIVPAHLLQQGNSWIAMGTSFARLIGMVAGGTCVVFFGGGATMIIAGSLYVCGAALTTLLPRVAANPETQTESLFTQLRGGWYEFRSRQWLWVCVASFAVLTMMFQAAHGVLGPKLAEEELGGSQPWTMVLVGEGLGAVIGVFVSLVWRPKYPIRSAIMLLLFAGLPMTMLGLSVPINIVVVAAVFMGFGFETFTVQWMTTMQTEVPPEALGRVASYDAFGSICMGPLGLIIAEPFRHLVGIHNAMLACGLVVLAVTLLALCFPEVRNLPRRVRVLGTDGEPVASGN
jgi:MFS family permease